MTAPRPAPDSSNNHPLGPAHARETLETHLLELASQFNPTSTSIPISLVTATLAPDGSTRVNISIDPSLPTTFYVGFMLELQDAIDSAVDKLLNS